MILALETGWLPDELSALPLPFRRQCHWALYARALAGSEGLPVIEVPRSGSPEVRMAAMRASVAVADLRTALFPEGD